MLAFIWWRVNWAYLSCNKITINSQWLGLVKKNYFLSFFKDTCGSEWLIYLSELIQELFSAMKEARHPMEIPVHEAKNVRDIWRDGPSDSTGISGRSDYQHFSVNWEGKLRVILVFQIKKLTPAPKIWPFSKATGLFIPFIVPVKKRLLSILSSHAKNLDLHQFF